MLFRHLREDALGFLGGGTAAFMRLGNHHEAEQAASFIGRHHTFAVSQFTVTRGGNQALTYGWGTGDSRGLTTTRGWTEDHSPSDSRTRSSSRSTSWVDGESWGDTTGLQRVYEYAVEPSVLQGLPGNVLLVPAPAGRVQAVECDPAIVTLPRSD